MPRKSLQATVTAVWFSAVCAAGLAGNLRSLSGWMLMLGLAVTPLVLMWRRDEPGPTTSENVQKALR